MQGRLCYREITTLRRQNTPHPSRNTHSHFSGNTNFSTTKACLPTKIEIRRAWYLYKQLVKTCRQGRLHCYTIVLSKCYPKSSTKRSARNSCFSRSAGSMGNGFLLLSLAIRYWRQKHLAILRLLCMSVIWFVFLWRSTMIYSSRYFQSQFLSRGNQKRLGLFILP